MHLSAGRPPHRPNSGRRVPYVQVYSVPGTFPSPEWRVTGGRESSCLGPCAVAVGRQEDARFFFLFLFFSFLEKEQREILSLKQSI